MEKTIVATSGGVGLGGLIFTILLVLKLTGNLAMSWFWVLTSIVWAPVLAFITLFIIISFFAIIIFLFLTVLSMTGK